MKDSLYLVAGLGKTGFSIARYLNKKDKPFVVFDTRHEVPNLSEFSTQFPHVRVYLGSVPEDVFAQLTDIIASPGVPLDTPVLKKARENGLAVYGDIECLVQEINAPVIAITGTNGKSTVTTLVGEMAKAAGLRVAVAGNIGTPVLDMLTDEPYDLWVLELSSFQLDLTFSLAPLVATILNISPDHLDRHHSFEAYVHAKHRVYNQAKILLYNRDDSFTIPSEENHLVIKHLSFGKNSPTGEHWGLIADGQSIYLAKGSEAVLPVEFLLIKGVHNWLNVLAAAALAEAAGIGRDHIVSVLKTFTGLAHRCQWVRTIDEVDWINDSKGTNVGATVSAINGIGGCMQGKIVLIAGGQGKDADFKDLAQPIADYVRKVILIGEDADKIKLAIDNTIPTDKAASLDAAVALAKREAKPGDVVLLSPACASFDMFRDFNDRGERFTDAVLGL